MMSEEQVMELGLFSATKRQPTDNLIVTEAENALQNQWRKMPLSITSNSLGGSDWALDTLHKAGWFGAILRGDKLFSQRFSRLSRQSHSWQTSGIRDPV